MDVFVDARADLVFNFGAPYTREALGVARRVRRSNLDAQRLHPIRITQRGAVEVCGVRFRLGGLGPFVRTPLTAWTDQTPAPADVLGPEATALETALRDAAAAFQSLLPGPDVRPCARRLLMPLFSTPTNGAQSLRTAKW